MVAHGWLIELWRGKRTFLCAAVGVKFGSGNFVDSEGVDDGGEEEENFGG